MRARTPRFWLTVAAAALGLIIVVAAGSAALIYADVPLGRRAVTATPLPQPTATSTPAATPLPAGNDWLQFRYDVYGTGVNPEGLIRSDTLAQLTPRWTASAPTSAPFGATPAIVDGVIYIPNGKALFAHDLRTGVQLWRFDGLGDANYMTTSSVAVDPDAQLAYYGTPDARVYAVNIVTGRMAWQRQLGDPSRGAYVWSSPLLANGKVYVGLASKNDHPCVRGAVIALNARTGAVAWTHYTDRDGEAGAGVWSSLTAIPELQTLVATTGNPCGTPDTDAEEDAIVGIDWNTGATLWMYTAAVDPACDCDFGEGSNNFVLNGKQYVVAGNKYGMVYALEVQGKKAHLAWSHRIATIDSFSRKLFGGIFQPPSYANGVVFVAGGTSLDQKCAGTLWAFKADTGTPLWHVCTKDRMFSPGTVSGDVLFTITGGAINEFDVATGTVLWTAPIDGGAWGGIAVAHGFLVVGTTHSKLYCYNLTPSS